MSKCRERSKIVSERVYVAYIIVPEFGKDSSRPVFITEKKTENLWNMDIVSIFIGSNVLIFRNIYILPCYEKCLANPWIPLKSKVLNQANTYMLEDISIP